ncbi:MAG: DUF5335 family protein [Pyrinomonadaceae bacterium]|nr:DUF5335 family protein [Pyrinomonadaceae bacterium]MBP6211566.1 DUF5335 family protein [Pyrinomonadaceae bacterium]
METAKRIVEWSEFLSFFSRQNTGRATRLGVFSSQNGIVIDNWIEDGLPLTNIGIESRGDHNLLHIKVGSLVHDVDMPLKLQLHMSLSGEEDGIDVLGADGRTTVLRFEAGTN